MTRSKIVDSIRPDSASSLPTSAHGHLERQSSSRSHRNSTAPPQSSTGSRKRKSKFRHNEYDQESFVSIETTHVVSSRTDIRNHPQPLPQVSPSTSAKLASSYPQIPPRVNLQPRSEWGHWSVVLVEGRGIATEIGLAALDQFSGQCVLMQFGDSVSFTRTCWKLSAWEPVEVLLPATSINPPSKLYQILQSTFPDLPITPLPRKTFNDATGLAHLETYATDDAWTCVVGKYYALACMSALVWHFEETESLLFSKKALRVKYCTVDNVMFIDPFSAQLLELTKNMTDPHSRQTLFGVMNHCKTAMGARVLRMTILQPITDLDTIETRLDAVQALLRDEEGFRNLQADLSVMLDMDQVIKHLITVPKSPSLKHAETSLNTLISLKHLLLSISNLASHIHPASDAILGAVKNVLLDHRLDQLLDEINRVVNDDITWQKTALALRNQRCYAIKSGVNKLLDVARATYKESTDDVYELIQTYTTTHSLTLKLQFNPTSGFHLSAATDEILPDFFINSVKKRKRVSCTTLDLIKLNDRITESLTEILLMSDKTVQELIAVLRADMNILYQVSESLALLDMIQSFAHLCTIHDYVRPEFTDTLAVKGGRHPIRDVIYKNFTPNDVFANSHKNFQIVTGPNMSGKSTYIRQIALLTIMSQTGSSVPATYASFRLTKKLFTRLGTDDNLETNASAFMVEMRDMAKILKSVDDESLVIIDELGRGTSTYDALGITFAIAEALIKTKAFTFFATHFHQLSNTLKVYPNVINLHLSIRLSPTSASPKFLYKVLEGVSTEQGHGISLAKAMGFPSDVIADAVEFAAFLRRSIEEDEKRSRASKEQKKDQICLELVDRLAQIHRSSTLLEPDLRRFLDGLQRDFLGALKGIEDEVGDEDEVVEENIEG